MKVSQLTPADLQARLAAGSLTLQIGPFLTRIRSPLARIGHDLRTLYADFTVAPSGQDTGFADFHVSVEPARGPRRWLRPQSVFRLDGVSPFKPLPQDQAFAMLEWGLNWCFGNHCHQYLIIHAAVIAKDDRAVIMPAPPGSGKSTLCAGLVSRGWRLLSDETALIRPDGLIDPIPRPLNLKNQSLEAIRRFAPGAVFGATVRDTAKGAVTHMKPPPASVEQAHTPAMPTWIIFPRYQAGADTQLTPLGKADAAMRLADNSFNYQIQGLAGFQTLTSAVEASGCYAFTYSRLDEAVEHFNQL